MLAGIPPALGMVGSESEFSFDYLYLIPGIAALMYAAMTFGIGSATFQGYHVPIPRYIDWALTTPLLVGYTAYVAGASRKTLLGVALADFLMIVFGVAAVALPEPSQWVFYALSSLCHLGLLIGLYGPVRSSAFEQPASSRRLSRLLLNYIGLLWLAYPLVWVFGPGLQWVSAEGIAVIVTYLDVTAKVPFVYFIYRSQKNSIRAENSAGTTGSLKEPSVANPTA